MKVQEIMSRNVEVISKESSLVEAANVMARRDIGFLPVLDGRNIVGTITDRDIVIRAVANGLNISSTSVGQIMTEGTETLSPNDDVAAAARRMEHSQIRRIVVKESDGGCVGVVSLGDLAKRSRDTDLAGEALEKICEPAEQGY